MNERSEKSLLELERLVQNSHEAVRLLTDYLAFGSSYSGEAGAVFDSLMRLSTGLYRTSKEMQGQLKLLLDLLKAQEEASRG